MRYYLDTEFIETSDSLDLISISLVSEDCRELYLINLEAQWELASQWVWNNVLYQIEDATPFPGFKVGSSCNKTLKPIKGLPWDNLTGIRNQVAEFIEAEEYYYNGAGNKLTESINRTRFRLKNDRPTPEIWANYASTDWVCLYKLFGTMMDLPKGFPMYINDIQQERNRLGNPDLPEQKSGNHTALEDAKWVKESHEYLRQIDLIQKLPAGKYMDGNQIVTTKLKPKDIQVGTNNYRTPTETQEYLKNYGVGDAPGVSHLL